jgi:hypothetical protein
MTITKYFLELFILKHLQLLEMRSDPTILSKYFHMCTSYVGLSMNPPWDNIFYPSDRASMPSIYGVSQGFNHHSFFINFLFLVTLFHDLALTSNGALGLHILGVFTPLESKSPDTQIGKITLLKSTIGLLCSRWTVITSSKI